jgi:transaldolase
VAIANARHAYVRYCERFAEPRWAVLRELGAHPQRPLWASTGTKDPAYSDVLYVEQLIAPDVVNTMPERTLRAFADHGRAARTLHATDPAAEATLRQARDAGVDLAAITAELEREGVRSFCRSYRELLDAIATRLGRRTSAPAT